MNVLPVIVRELRTQARQPFTYWLRVLGVAALLVCGFFFASEMAVSPNRGGALFGYMHLTLMGAVWILVPLGAADCLSRERREGTLGLLFLTPLNARDIVIAKGLSHGLRGITLLVAVLPALTLPFLIGGVTWQQAAASALINVSGICWALASALVASALARNGLRAMALAALLAVLALLVCSFIGGVLLLSKQSANVRSDNSAWEFYFLAGFVVNGLHPQAWNVWAGTTGMVSVAQVLVVIFQSAAISVFGLALAVLFAARRVRRSWQEEPPSARAQQIDRVFFQPVLWVSFLKRWMRSKLERNPIGWLEQRRWSGRLVVWTWLAIIISVQTLALTDPGFFQNYRSWSEFMAWMLTFSMAASAAGSLRRERETGVLELLLVSPLTTRQLISGRLRGLWGQFLPSIVLLLSVWFYFQNLLPNRERGTAQIWFFLVTYSVLPVVGLYFSVRSRHFITAFVLTLAMVIATPVLLTSVVKFAFALMIGRSAYFGMFGQDAYPAIILIQLILAVEFGKRLHHRLETRSFPLERGLI